MNRERSAQVTRLAGLVQLEKRVRAAGLEELGFIIVNETVTILPYRQSLFWQKWPRSKVIAVSGVATAEPNAPYIIWARQLCAHIERLVSSAPHAGGIRQFIAADLPQQVARQWPEWFPAYLVWIPIGSGALLLGREKPLDEAEESLLPYVADAYDHAWRARFSSGRLMSRTRRRKERGDSGRGIGSRLLIAAALLAVVAAGFYPVRQSVLASAEVIPRQPSLARAPLNGVISQIMVRPNEHVSEGQLLFVLDPRDLRNQLEVSTRAREAMEVELRQAQQASVMDPQVRANLPVLRGKLEQQQAEVNYLTEQLNRIEVKAERAGLAVFDDPNDWLGRPVVIGERIMLIADPANVEIEAQMPAADAIDLTIGSPVRLFLNIAPERPLDGELTFVSYQPRKGVDGVLGYRVKAALAPDEAAPRVGLKGTAKLYGDEVPLAYFLFRRPIAAARQWLGL